MKKVLAWICAAAMWVTVFCVPAGAAEKTEKNTVRAVKKPAVLIFTLYFFLSAP